MGSIKFWVFYIKLVAVELSFFDILLISFFEHSSTLYLFLKEKKSRIYRFLNERNPVLIAVKGRGHEKNKNDFRNKGSLDEGNEE